MFIGHLAVGLAAKRVAPRTSLGWLVAAPFFLDLLWPIFLLLGWERVSIPRGGTPYGPFDFASYPWSHSLVTSIGWGIVLGALCWSVTRDRRGALVVAALVVSHWVLDALVHGPDLPLWPGSVRVGLGLWAMPRLESAIEWAMYAAGIALYLRAAPKRRRAEQVAFWSLVVFVAVVFVGSNGPPPADWHPVAWAALALWLLPAWGALAERRSNAAAPLPVPPVPV